MSTDLMNISAFKGVAPAAAFKVLDPQSESLADGIGSSYGIIGYKGKVWSLRLRGDTFNFVRPDDGSPAAWLDVIILRQLPNKSKSYYLENSYQDGQIGTRPLCASLDGVVPDADITTPQASACAICPRNVFKIRPDGKKTRECSDFKRLAVLILPSLTKALLGAPLMEPVFLRVPAASLNDLALLGEGMTAQGFHFSSYVTRIGFNPDKPHPQMTFRALQALTDKEAPVVLPLREDPIAMRITGEGEIGKPRPAITQQTQQQVQQPVQQVVSNVVPLTANPNQQQTVQQPAQQAQPAPATAQNQPIDTGFGDIDPNVKMTNGGNPTAALGVDHGNAGSILDAGPATTVAEAPTNTAADTGITEDADDDLDSRVSALLKR